MRRVHKTCITLFVQPTSIKLSAVLPATGWTLMTGSPPSSASAEWATQVRRAEVGTNVHGEYKGGPSSRPTFAEMICELVLEYQSCLTKMVQRDALCRGTRRQGRQGLQKGQGWTDGAGGTCCCWPVVMYSTTT